MNKIDLTPALSFDDVTIIPRASSIESRLTVDVKTKGIFDCIGRHPIVSANMRSVTDVAFASLILHHGGMGFVHRFYDPEKLRDDVLKHFGKKINEFAVFSVGVDKDSDKLIELLEELEAAFICIDVAHGDHIKVYNAIHRLKQLSHKPKIIAGNVCTYEAGTRLVDSGADAIKVGVGPGSHCTTRVVTGHGIPQISAIMDCASLPVTIIADGGVRNSGDVAKAIVAGAHYVMIGKLFAGCSEAPSRLVSTPNGLKKVYAGSASLYEQQAQGRKKEIIVEGVESLVPFTGPLSETYNQLIHGLQSACSYSGCSSVNLLRVFGKFRRITTAAYIEGTPHGS